MEYSTPQPLLSPREDILVFLRAFARSCPPKHDNRQCAYAEAWSIDDKPSLN